MASHLDKIVAHTREVVAGRKAAADTSTLERRAREHTPRGFARALKQQGIAAADAGKQLNAEFRMKYADWPSMDVANLVQRIYNETP